MMRRLALPILLIVVGLALACFGAARGEMAVALTKATHICLECIGIG